MKLDHYSYLIATHFVCAIINDDYSGLDDSEEADLRAFLAANKQRGGHWDCNDDNPEFCTDEVSGLKNECVLVRQYFPLRVE